MHCGQIHNLQPQRLKCKDYMTRRIWVCIKCVLVFCHFLPSSLSYSVMLVWQWIYLDLFELLTFSTPQTGSEAPCQDVSKSQCLHGCIVHRWPKFVPNCQLIASCFWGEGIGRDVLLLELVNRNQLACFCSEGTRICEICEICYGYLWIGIQNIKKRFLPGVVEWSRPQCNPGQPFSFIVAWKVHFRDWWETAAGKECRTNRHVECSRVPKYLTISNILPVYPFLVLTQWQHLRMAKRPGGQLIEECRNLFEPHTLAIICNNPIPAIIDSWMSWRLAKMLCHCFERTYPEDFWQIHLWRSH